MIFLNPVDWRVRCDMAHVAKCRNDYAPWAKLTTNAAALPLERVHLLSDEIVRWASASAVASAHAYLFIFESGIFPSADRRVLYQCLRARFGNFESIESSPGHEFMGHERAELAAVIECAMLNAWGFTVEFETAARAVAVDHDGEIKVWAESGEASAEAELFACRVRGER